MDEVEDRRGFVHSKDALDFVDIDFREDYSVAEEAYPSETNEKPNKFAAKLRSKVGISSLLIVVGTIALVTLIAVVIPGSSNVSLEGKVTSLERRLQKLEGTLFRLEWIEAKLEQIEENNRQFSTFMNTFEKLERTTKRPVTQVSTKPTATLYHQVRAGETLFSISRDHGLTVEELRRLNQLKSGEIIHPEQRLLVRAARDR